MKDGGTLAGVAYPRLVPSGLLPPEDPADAARRRTLRDWFVDVTAVVFAAGIGVLVFGDSIDSATRHVGDAETALDLLLGTVCCVALWWRRRWPVRVGVLTATLSIVSGLAGVASVIGLFTVAVHRRTSVALAVAALNVAAGALFPVYRPQDMDWWISALIGLVIVVIVTAWGMVVRARRQLVWTLRARAERAEAEQRVQAEQARHAERTRIAREMHDVLAHRISLLALHAGGLEVRPDLPADGVRETAALLRSTAQRALEELRGVIGVLRESNGEDAPAQPQPTLRDIPRLVDETRRAGAKITFELAVPDGADPPDPIGRDAYRVVQEALTNVAKHARGTATTVRVSGGPGDGLTVAVRNRLPVRAASLPLAGSGSGLLGLHERVTLAGGTLRSGPDGAGDFVVEARLAWR